MNAATQPRWTLGWKLAFFVPLIVALTLTLAARTQADLQRQIELTIAGNIFGTASLIAQAVYWIVVKKWKRRGIAMLIFVSAVLVSVHTLFFVPCSKSPISGRPLPYVPWNAPIFSLWLLRRTRYEGPPTGLLRCHSFCTRQEYRR